jgi:hypothetical protein
MISGKHSSSKPTKPRHLCAISQQQGADGEVALSALHAGQMWHSVGGALRRIQFHRHAGMGGNVVDEHGQPAGHADLCVVLD